MRKYEKSYLLKKKHWPQNHLKLHIITYKNSCYFQFIQCLCYLLGFYQTSDGCRHCHHYCRECNDSGPLHCTSCPSRFMLDGGLCMECLGSQYLEASSGACRSCDNTCRTCSGPGKYSCSGCSRPLRLDRWVFYY